MMVNVEEWVGGDGGGRGAGRAWRRSAFHLPTIVLVRQKTGFFSIGLSAASASASQLPLSVDVLLLLLSRNGEDKASSVQTTTALVTRVQVILKGVNIATPFPSRAPPSSSLPSQ